MSAQVRRILEQLQRGALSVDDAERALAHAPFEDLGFAKVDHHRPQLQGSAEVIFCEGKTPDEVAAVARALIARHSNVLATRASPQAFHAVRMIAQDATYYERARVIVVERERPTPIGSASLVCAGTSDLTVLEECAVCAHAFGIEPRRFVDVGVAGLHRLLAVRDDIDRADVVIVVAGMEGALPSVVAGLTKRPVIAVPTSVGYGASFQGLAALLSMLNACSSGIVVTNIDNGFGAAAAARRMLQPRGA